VNLHEPRPAPPVENGSSGAGAGRGGRAGLAAGLLVLALGSGLTLLVYRQVREAHRRQVEAAFQSAAQDRIEAIDRGLQHGFEAVLGLRDHLQAAGRLDPATFAGYAAPVHGRHRYLQALQWLPRVGPDNRAELEGQGRRLDPAFRFFTRDAAGTVRPVPADQEFFAVQLVEPLAGNEVSLGYSASQLATRQMAVRQALETGELATTGPLTLIQESGSQSGFLAMVPIPGPDGRPKGLVQGVFRAGDLVRRSMAFLEPKGIGVRLSSRFHWEQDHPLHTEGSRLKPIGRDARPLRLERTFEMAGRLWTVQATAEGGRFSRDLGLPGWIILATGGGFTLILAGYLRMLLERTDAVRLLVVARTRELQAETERHRRDAQALRASEARYRQLVEAMDQGLWILDTEGRTTFVNRRLAGLLGCPPADMGGRPFTDFLHEAEAPRGRRLLGEWLAGAGVHHDLRFRRRDGGELWAIVAGSLVAGTEGEPAGILAMVTDVTERRRTEEQQLQSQKLESLGVLAGGIAHDFNNLLAAMLGNLGIAQLRLGEDSELRTPLDNLEKSLLRAAHLTRQMLAYAGKAQSQVAPLDFNQAVSEISHLIAVSHSKKVQVRYELAPGLPALNADAAQLQQVVMNLVTNAAEAIGDREGTVTLTTGMRSWTPAGLAEDFPGQAMEPGDYLTLEVRDTGCGISPEVKARIFEPFYTTKFAGRGLGLSSMQGIVRGHGGGIRIESDVGHGTAFLVAFPLRWAAGGSPEAALDAPPWRGSGTVLLVEDEAAVRETTEVLLRGLGFQVVTAADGQEAVDRFAAAPGDFRAVLLDYTMPRMNGLEAFRAMLAIDPGCRAILTSGYREPEALDGPEALRFAVFLPKPYHRRDLELALRRTLEP